MSFHYTNLFCWYNELIPKDEDHELSAMYGSLYLMVRFTFVFNSVKRNKVTKCTRVDSFEENTSDNFHHFIKYNGKGHSNVMK